MSAAGPPQSARPLGGTARSEARGDHASKIPAFVRQESTVERLPLILDSPHSGEHYPDDFDHLPPRALVRQAEDTHVARLYHCAPRLGATLIEATFPRAYIDPYKGVEIVKKHGRPAQRRHSLQIELNRRLYMDETTLEANAHYAEMAVDIERLLAAIAAYVRTQL